MSRKRLRKQHVPILALVVVIVVAIAQQVGWLPTSSSAPSHSVAKTNASAASDPPGMYAIDHFIDGDTVAVNMNGTVESVRFIGVDTPETHKPNTPVQCYGPAAAAFTKSSIGTGRVRLVSDSLSTDRDRYNRLLRYVYLPDGRLLDEMLVQNGYGFAYTQFPFTKSAAFTADQIAAKNAAKGLWGNCQPYQESDGRWQSNNQ